MSHLIQDRSHLDGNRHYDCRRGTKQVRAHYPFFLRPYIHFGNMHHEPLNDVTLTSSGESLTFSTNVWVIKIENKKHGTLTRNAFNSNVEITQFKNGIDIGKTVNMVWNDSSLPNKCRFPSSSLSREDYRAKIPFCYVKELIHKDSSTTILAGGTRDLILGCTFNDFHSLYMVSKRSVFGEEDVISIPFNELASYEFLIKFSSQITKHKKFKLNATSWNDVKLTWV
jgi:hypothetical protein